MDGSALTDTIRESHHTSFIHNPHNPLGFMLRTLHPFLSLQCLTTSSKTWMAGTIVLKACDVAESEWRKRDEMKQPRRTTRIQVGEGAFHVVSEGKRERGAFQTLLHELTFDFDNWGSSSRNCLRPYGIRTSPGPSP